MYHLCYFCLVLFCFHARLFVDALWSPAGKGLTSWLSYVMTICDVVTFPVVSWVRCGALLFRFLIFDLFLTLSTKKSLITSGPGLNKKPKYSRSSIVQMTNNRITALEIKVRFILLAKSSPWILILFKHMNSSNRIKDSYHDWESAH